MHKPLLIALALAVPLVPGPVSAAPAGSFQATFVENPGGPSATSDCAAGTSCGTANLGSYGKGTSVVQFGACGEGCHVRTIAFEDGSTLVLREVPQGQFTSPGSSGSHGYNGAGFEGNPQRLDITQTVLDGTGRFAGASGSGSGTVKSAGGSITIKTSGTLATG